LAAASAEAARQTQVQIQFLCASIHHAKALRQNLAEMSSQISIYMLYSDIISTVNKLLPF